MASGRTLGSTANMVLTSVRSPCGTSPSPDSVTRLIWWNGTENQQLKKKHAHTCICKLYTQYIGILCHTTVHEICSLYSFLLPSQSSKIKYYYYNIPSKSCSENTQKKEEEKQRKRGKIRQNNGAFSSTFIETQRERERERERKDTQQAKQRKGRERREMKNNGAFCFDFYFIARPCKSTAFQKLFKSDTFKLQPGEAHSPGGHLCFCAASPPLL